MNEEISVPRFPILEFRIPKFVWRMGNLEYRTMRLRVRGGGSSKGILYRGGGGHGMSYANSGGRTLDVLGGTWSSSVKSESDQ